MTRTAIILKGVSACGKGTRVSTLLEYLKSRYKYESVMIQGKVGDDFIHKPWQLAVAFPELKILFVGRWVRSNKKNRLISWSSLDGISGYQDTLYYDIPKYFNDYSIIKEGYYGGRGDNISPKFLVSCGISNIYYFHFLYKEMEELQQRCIGRSGSTIKGSCFSDNIGYLKPGNQEKMINSTMNEYQSAGGNGLVNYSFHEFTESPVEFGVSALIALGLIDDAKQFKKCWLDFSTLRNVDNYQENHDKYSKYLLGDSKLTTTVNIYNEDGTLNGTYRSSNAN